MMLIKYGKKIVDEQYLLNKLANSIIDIYAMSVVLSRASKALKEGSPTAAHEKTIAQSWCYEVSIHDLLTMTLYLVNVCYLNCLLIMLQASERTQQNLKLISSSKYLENNGKQSQLALDICNAGGVIYKNPLNL